MRRILSSANLVEVSNGKLFVNDYEPPAAKGRFLVVERDHFEVSDDGYWAELVYYEYDKNAHIHRIKSPDFFLDGHFVISDWRVGLSTIPHPIPDPLVDRCRYFSPLVVFYL